MTISVEEYMAKREAIYKNYELGWLQRAQALDSLWEAYCDGLEVGDRANVCLYTDVNPCTVIRRTAKTITVRYDKGELDPNWKPEIIPGGFCGHCTNQEDQVWILEEDPNGHTETFRRRKNGWYNRSDCRLTPGWKKFYDYNF